MLKIFYQIDEMDSIEANLVAEAANRLDIGEFQVFQLSYLDWFGHEVEEKSLEKIFFAYLMENRIPPWARHYARKIIDLDDKGELDYHHSSYHGFDVESMKPGERKVGALKAAAVLVIVAAAFGASLYLLHGHDSGMFPCQFPPCVDVR